MKVSFFEVDEEQQSYLQTALTGVSFDKGPLTPANAFKYADSEVIAIRVYSQVTEELLSRLPNLKLLLTMSTGTDHIDADACKRHGVTLRNVKGYCDETVAEYVFTLLLALIRRLLPTLSLASQGRFSESRLKGYELSGKTMGIVGCGKIGLSVAKIANGFGMKIVVYDIVHHDDWASENNFSYVGLDELLKSADIITLHLPLNKKTHKIIGEKAFAKMKKGVVLINTARGGLVDTTALINALQERTLLGAGLDVFNEERFFENHPLTELEKRLFDMDSVILTPHNAFNTAEALRRRLDATIKSIKEFSGTNKSLD